ncbi:MAG: FAD-binding oxidoreductase [Bacillota bacterium]|nr:MAG: FAD-binding oxidoreductase [Bacillota bacterium]
MESATSGAPRTGFDVLLERAGRARRPFPTRLVGELGRITGPGHVLTRDADLAVYARDSWTVPALRVHHGRPLPVADAVVLPGDTAEVAAVMTLLYENDVPVIPFGGGSGVLGGTLPITGGVIVDVKRLDKVLDINDEGLTATAQAGIIGTDFETALGRAGFTWGHFPQSTDVGTLGGFIVTRSAGQFSTKYGNIEDILLAVEAVLPGGAVIRTKTTARSSTGPDIKSMFVGSEGTLGIVTEATVRIHPRPERRDTRAYEVEDFADGLEIIRRVMRTGLRPAVIRLYDPIESLHSFKERVTQGKCVIVFFYQGLGRLVDLEVEVVEETVAAFRHRKLGSEPGWHWYKRRNVVSGLPEFMTQGLVVDTLEVAATWERIPALYRAMIDRMLAVKGIVSASAHSSHSYSQGTNLYVTFLAFAPDIGTAEALYQSIWDAAMEACLEAGGTIGHHHGIGLHRAKYMPGEHGPALEVLRRLRSALDPKGLMNPGKLFGKVG